MLGPDSAGVHAIATVMTNVTLLASTGNARVDTCIRSVIAAFTAAFPGHNCSYYVEGSFADGSAIATSDLDMTIVFAAPPTADEHVATKDILRTCARSSDVELDVTPTDLQALQHADPVFKLGAQLVYGTDVRDRVPLMPIESWARQRMHVAFWLTIHAFKRPQPVAAPLDFPKADDKFFGYVDRPMRLADGTEVASTRDLTRVTGWIASTRLAFEARQYVYRKRDCVPLYAQYIADEWTELLAALYRRCRVDWHYRVPQRAAERDELRALCVRTLAFENHFAARYRRFVLDELRSADAESRRVTLEVLELTQIADPDIVAAAQAARSLTA